jgi:catechol 2,3-dioxygenase-like lactoylglutathione lyase family enzyme
MHRPQHLGLHHLALRVSDLPRAKAFYVGLLGYQVEWQPDSRNLYLTCGNDNLALHQADNLGPAPRQGVHLDHLGIVVATPDAVAAWEAYLRLHEVPILAKTKAHRDGATSCYVSDPDGIAVQFIHHPPISPHLSARTA